jgi:hypothetical protein
LGFFWELIVGCKNSPQYGGAIYVAPEATCNIDGGTFLSNHASGVSQQRNFELIAIMHTKNALTSAPASGLPTAWMILQY